MTHSTVVTFGELLLRLDPPAHERILQTQEYRVSFTGGEANVAVALSLWGIPSRIVSRVPEHLLGDACLNHFRRYGVDTTHVVRGGERLGILFVETGAGQRLPQVIYDRSHSAFRSLQPQACDWDTVFQDAGWLHFTGTAPAVGGDVRQTLVAALRAAKERGMTISFDCSYRSALWTVAEAASVLPPLLEFVDVFIGSESDAQQFFGIAEQGTDCLQRFQQEYELQCVAFTERVVHGNGIHRYSATIADESRVCASRVHEIAIVDRIGAGDAFAAGVIRGRLTGQDLQQTTDFAVAAAVLTHSIPGDFALLSVAEIERLASADSSGRGWR